jgi:DNA-binding NarL/FixJ family response regulator
MEIEGITMSTIRVLLADDHAVLVEAFRKLLEPHFEVVGTVSDGRALLKAAAYLNPDVIVIDISMPLMNGLEAAARLKAQLPKAHIIILTMNDDTDLALEAIRLGVSGYLLKSSAGAELIHAVNMVTRGVHYVTPLIALAIEETVGGDHQPVRDAKTLSLRQREVVLLLAEGKSMKEAGAILNLTPRTIAFHKYRAMRQLHVNTSAELVQFAIKSRIIVS